MLEKIEKSLAARITLLVLASIVAAQTLTLVVFALLLKLHLIIPPAKFTIYLAVAFCSSAVLGTAIAAGLSEKLSSAYETYKKALREIASGNFDIVVPEQKGALFGQISRDINAMTRELKGNRIMRNDFISNFSHELKTPIVSINGFAELLMSDKVSDEERIEYAGIIYTESSRLLNLAKNTLLLSKLEGQSFVCDKKVFRLDECIESAAILFAKPLKDKNITIKCDLDKILYCWDADLITQVIINLISNAIKYNKENGEIDVSLKKVNDEVVFTVKDSGVGMDKATLDRVFDRYFQGDSSHKSEGNGLGLSIVDRIVKLCEGRITVTSKLGEGSEFKVVLPDRAAA
ncbi:MAG: HAMP domain-containing sensor histidine kinase [Candidatus Borkfalkiaceae bacterium]|nr:HAMP domain-containing sensor histidine kinase [Christensenellaceae bacterium]